ALLSVQPVAEASVHGVVVYDLADHLPAVDEREAGYRRKTVEADKLTIEAAPQAAVPVHIYEASRGASDAHDLGSMILQSYLDAVMQGFRSLYGDDGLRRFVSETEGFETRIVKDRAAPRYPRFVALGPGEAELFDRLAEARGARFVEGD
ncbi:MAG: gamma-glutamylcyclotransferase, partial [Fulvimarina manganoxydans]|uniref:gamma-glutamylcyclotransferase n=1 Tax=Fulvimarina manganoxydans TaxID=937218 RepID=UPI002354EC75